MGAYLGGARRRLVADRQTTSDDRRGSAHVRRVCWFRWLPLALVTLVSSGCVLTSPAAADAATIVAPSQLVPGHTVRLQLSGFPAGDRIYVQLGVVTNPVANCCVSFTYPSFGKQAGIPVDSSGSLRLDWAVPTTYVQCPSTACLANPPPNNTRRYVTGQHVYVAAFDASDSAFAKADAVISVAPPPPFGYVALGDSYSSGEANPPFVQPNTGCDRSKGGAWPQLMARSLQIPMRAVLACSGATTAALTNSFKKMPPQLLALARMNPRPKLVTITIGGNDLGFTYVLTSCYLSICSTALAGVEGSFAGGFGTHMTAVYRLVKQSVPGAQIVVVGYPQIIPNSPITALRHCPWLKDPAEPALMRQVTSQLVVLC